MSKDTSTITDTADLRNFLLNHMIGVSDGSVTHDQARAICNIANQVHNTLATEIKMMRAAKETGTSELPPVRFKQ